MSGMLLELSSRESSGANEPETHDRRATTRLGLDGVLSAQRFDIIDGDHATLVTYELDDLDALSDDDLPAATLPEDQRSYVSLGIDSVNDGYALERCSHLLAVLQSVAPTNEEEFNAWYNEEHVPMLSEVPGWLRSRRYQRHAGNGPNFLAYHELASVDVFDTPEFAACRNTPWRDTIVSYRTDYESRLCRLVVRH